MEPRQPEWIAGVEAAAMLGIKPGTLRLWVMNKKIPSYKIGGKRLFDKADIVAFIEKSRIEAEKK